MMRRLILLTTRTVVCLAAAAMLVPTLAPLAQADPVWGDLDYTPFSDMQAVNSSGGGTWSVPIDGTSSDPGYKVRGVVLNSPGDMLDGTPNYIPSAAGTQWQLGALWQVYIQAIALPGDATNAPELLDDFGGSALWLGQNYGNHAWHHPGNTASQADYDEATAYSYTNSEWQDELDRLNLAGGSIIEPLRPGDVIEVCARGGLFHAGKFNVNEQHDNASAFDFDITIIERDYVLNPEEISLAAVKYESDAFIFDQTRATGAEHYQATLVTIEDVWVQNPANWAPNATVTLEDATGRTLPMLLGLDSAFGTTAPTGTFDVTGIFDQESSDGTSGYRLWVIDADQFGGTTGVPEPTGAVLALLGLIGLVSLGRKRRA